MAEEPALPNKPVGESPAYTPKRGKRTGWWAVLLLLLVFLAGFLPMWLKSSRHAGKLDLTQRDLRRAELQLLLANTALDARRGEYELARQGAASFFTTLTAELERGVGSAVPAGARQDARTLLNQRDDLITLLARSDPAVVERLASLYHQFRQSLGQ
jgi:hypothetical protein